MSRNTDNVLADLAGRVAFSRTRVPPVDDAPPPEPTPYWEIVRLESDVASTDWQDDFDDRAATRYLDRAPFVGGGITLKSYDKAWPQMARVSFDNEGEGYVVDYHIDGTFAAGEGRIKMNSKIITVSGTGAGTLSVKKGRNTLLVMRNAGLVALQFSCRLGDVRWVKNG